MCNDSNSSDSSKNAQNLLIEHYKITLESMRAREETILPFVGLVGAPLAGYIWIILEYGTLNNMLLLTTLTVGVVGILAMAIGYLFALTYNYRTIQVTNSRILERFGLIEDIRDKYNKLLQNNNQQFKYILPNKWYLTYEKLDGIKENNKEIEEKKDIKGKGYPFPRFLPELFQVIFCLICFSIVFVILIFFIKLSEFKQKHAEILCIIIVLIVILIAMIYFLIKFYKIVLNKLNNLCNELDKQNLFWKKISSV